MAFSLSSRSLGKLEGVKPELVEVVKKAIELTKTDFGVIYGMRTKEEQQKLKEEVERLKKAGNYIDAEQTHKSAFASMKTRLENQIKDLDNARKLKTPIDKRSKLQLTKEQQDEIDEITKRLDIAKELYKKMFPPETKKLDDQDRLAAAIKRTEQRIEKLEDHIERGVPIDEPSTVEPNEELRKLQ